MRNGYVSERPTLVLRTVGIGSSSWPTATTQDANSSGAAGYSTESGRHSGTTLTDATKQWATPNAHERTHSPREVDHGIQIANQASQWATPLARDARSEVPQSGSYSPPLGLQVLMGTGPESTDDSGPLYLNPSFVEWLMGLPSDWSAFDSSVTESSRSKLRQLWRSLRDELCPRRQETLF